MKIVPLLVFLFPALPVWAQFKPQFPVDTLRINSVFLKEDRVAWVQKPNGYDTSSKTYPLLMVLDADGHFNYATQILPYLHNQFMKEIPAMLVVGIPSTRRSAILTPKTGNMQYDTIRNRGEAGLFLEFIENELLTRLGKEYRINNFRVLLGHSLGGLFSIYAMYAKPRLFRAVIAASPSAGYANGVSYKKFVPEILKQQNDSTRYFYFSVSGNDIANYDKENEKLRKTLEKYPATGLIWDFETFKTMNHWTTAPVAFYSGLIMLFNRKEFEYLKH